MSLQLIVVKYVILAKSVERQWRRWTEQCGWPAGTTFGLLQENRYVTISSCSIGVTLSYVYNSFCFINNPGVLTFACRTRTATDRRCCWRCGVLLQIRQIAFECISFACFPHFNIDERIASLTIQAETRPSTSAGRPNTGAPPPPSAGPQPPTPVVPHHVWLRQCWNGYRRQSRSWACYITDMINVQTLTPHRPSQLLFPVQPMRRKKTRLFSVVAIPRWAFCLNFWTRQCQNEYPPDTSGRPRLLHFRHGWRIRGCCAVSSQTSPKGILYLQVWWLSCGRGDWPGLCLFCCY